MTAFHRHLNCNLWTWIHVQLLQYCYYNIAATVLIKSSSNVIYGYHLTGKWTGAPSSGMDYGMDNGMYSWWHHFISFLAFRSRRIDIDVNSKLLQVHVHNLPFGKYCCMLLISERQFSSKNDTKKMNDKSQTTGSDGLLK